ncbi:hypothetical protein BDU57DRAFT_520189 [Ampelomyces quisqualis]|uniref:Uncharacterized protein n=1 Tax=Ampelomyces quisqualis TaxID=50730 RepID=A0A6A5QJB2_AMPQU|nr:hypothetical protein BDU57DRAFT_520189 [Ampelomyces quisqualis]
MCVPVSSPPTLFQTHFAMNAFTPPPMQHQPQQPQGSMPQPQYPQSPQPTSHPYQAVPNMTSQQLHPVQQVIQSYPEKFHIAQQPQQPQQQLQQQPPKLHYTTTAPSGLFGSKHPSPHGNGPQDAQKSDSVKRFLGDTLVGRVARSSVQTATSMAKMPMSLSPWGDNNPVTLPNVRYRDAVLFTTFAFVGGPLVDGAADGITSTFGADSFISEIVNSGAGAIAASTILKYGVFQIVEQAIDKGILEHMLPEEEKMLVTTNVKSLQVGLKHKLMGVDADLRFWGTYKSVDEMASEKGWLCPLLFASARTPSVPRGNDFGIAQCFGPFLGGDYLLAQKLLWESVHTLPMCEANPEIDIGTNRMVILFTGIAPYRGVWSQSRRPGCGTIIFHLLDGCPALVIPVTKAAPITAWSPWTLSQMRAAPSAVAGYSDAQNSGGYSPEWQHEQICEFLDTIISIPHVHPALQQNYVHVLSRMVSLVINGALALDRCTPILGKLDPTRAGICMLRY